MTPIEGLLMSDFIQSFLNVIERAAEDPSTQTKALLGGILVALLTLVARRRNRSRVHIDAPKGEAVRVEIGKDGKSDA